MKALKHVMLIASIVAIPTLSFAQQMNAPMNDTTPAPTVSMHDTQNNQAGTQYQQPSHKMSGYGDSSGYGAPATSFSQSSTMHFAGKDSRLFKH
ncbi:MULTISPECIES: hypothetical protein [Paraburkholderia]|uniref:hypothetical protein n=1 Tax=Paraburkholderia TaxID=1822464 RepID=UPI001B28B487|nr:MULTISPECIES: hypothetical protein [Paraburkholderia]MCP2091251.1 hypothetical protein [Paraburkholderia sediminicola]MCX4157070.1 hypothetical protein [Paraburkholderia aspalathi]MDN7166474.1 hypothetical protein [Paraburkholderia sp. SECH2]MDQ6394960.1 hypothetical protein [Paraburkholderia aspalathi]CAE6744192.1 hypothetical protein R75465_02412 [Paraburkholderia aspalathi]